MTRVTRYLALTAVLVSFAACASPTEPTTTKPCAQKSSAAQPTCPVAEFTNPNV